MSIKHKYFTDISSLNNFDSLSIDLAKYLDDNDPLNSYRNKFNFPKSKQNEEAIYFNGNSLGLMPKDSKLAIDEQLDKWANRGGEGHIEEPLPWLTCDEYLLDNMADIVGAKREEIALMNQLSVNLHLMLVSFYRPTKEKYKILCEFNAFPSDHYAFESQIAWHGYDSKKGLLTIKPRENENNWRTEDIIEFIEKNGHEISLICFSGVHFLTGQYFNIDKITEVGHRMGCMVGWDMAHAVGNVLLQLHNWNVDFAVWCSYKYLNSGPGGIGGIFIHEKNLNNPNIPYFQGWWGHRISDRMEMKNEFIPAVGALKYRISNTSFTSCALLHTSLKIFKEIGMEKLREKSVNLTNYFEYLLRNKLKEKVFTILTPENINERGSQISLFINCNIEMVDKIIKDNNIFCDYRKPSILRLAPCALYNSFVDVFKVVEIFTALNFN